MDILRQKRLTVSLCAMVDGDGTDEPWTEPAYTFEIAGIKCALAFRTDDQGVFWEVVDLQYGLPVGEIFRTFNDAAEALRDETWLIKEHDKLMDAGIDEIEQSGFVFYTVDNPLKGIPGIVLLPRFVPPRTKPEDTDAISDEDAELTIQEIMNETDYDDDDDDSAEAELSVKTDDDQTKIGWEELINQQMSDDEDDVDVDMEEYGTPEFDSEEDVDVYIDQLYKRLTFKLDPTAAFVSRVGSHRVAFRVLSGFDRFALWQAFDITIGLELWESLSLAEVMRIAPLMVPVVTETEIPQNVQQATDLPLKTALYLNELTAVFDGSDRELKQYLESGYLKMVGPQYMQLMDRLYLDKGSPRSEKHWKKWGYDDSDDTSAED